MSEHRLTTREIECAKAVDLVRLVAGRVKLTRKGRVFWGLCPFHKDKSPSFKVEKGRFHCFGCSADGDAIKWLRETEQLTFPEAVRRLAGEEILHAGPAIAPPPPSPPTDERQADKANWLWRERRKPQGTPAEVYLRSRGYVGRIPATIGFLAPTRPEYHPAMISAFGITAESEPGVLTIRDSDVRAVHLTLLKADGSGKADVDKPKIMVGSVKDQPIVLAPPNDLLGLGITEGIEDGLSVHAAMGFGVWAAASASFMSGLADGVPDYIDCITIFAHPDMAGQDGAHKLAASLRERGWTEKLKKLSIVEFGASS